MKAIILAAGNSTRYGTNKLLTKFLGKTLPEYNIDFCIENDITEIYVSISKAQTIIKDGKAINPIVENIKKYKADKKVNISFKYQDTDKYGPAAGLLPWLDKIDDSVLVLFGDNFLKGKFDKELLKEYDAIATYKELKQNKDNTRFGAIDGITLIEKPHDITKGKFFCGFSYYTKKGFMNLNLLKPSLLRNEYEITEFFNSIEKRNITPVVKYWIDLTYKSDDKKILKFIKESQTQN